MRPEYLEAVNAVRWGWSLWIVFLVPSAIIWCSVLWRSSVSPGERGTAGCALFAFACFAFWFLAIFHANQIQSAKKSHMRTDAERADWSSDTWRTVAPMTAIPVSLVYCTLNVLAAGTVSAAMDMIVRRRRTPAGDSAPGDSRDHDTSPYKPPQSLN